MECDVTEQFYNDKIYPSLFSVAAITLIIPICLYTKAYIKGTLQSSKSMFYAGFILFLIILIYYISYAMSSSTYCNNGSLHWIFRIPVYYLYTTQGILLLIILFMRLKLIFKGIPSLSLSQTTITIFVILTVTCLAASFSGFTMILFLEMPDIGNIVSAILVFPIYITLVLWLNILFILKLQLVYKRTNTPTTSSSITSEKVFENENDKLVEIITKTSILSFTSTLMIIIFSIFHILTFFILSEHYVLISRLFLIADLQTNFFSILLSYNYFNPWYMKICGNCHAKCHICWNTISQEDVHNLVTELEPRSPSPSSENEM